MRETPTILASGCKVVSVSLTRTFMVNESPLFNSIGATFKRLAEDSSVGVTPSGDASVIAAVRTRAGALTGKESGRSKSLALIGSVPGFHTRTRKIVS